ILPPSILKKTEGYRWQSFTSPASENPPLPWTNLSPPHTHPIPAGIIPLHTGDNAFKIAHADNIEKRGGQHDATRETENTYDRLTQGGAPVNVTMIANSPDYDPVPIRVHVDMAPTSPPLKRFKFYVITEQQVDREPDIHLYFNHRNIITRIFEPWPAHIYRPQPGDNIFTLSHPDNLKRRGGLNAVEQESSKSFDRLLAGGDPIKDSTEIRSVDGPGIYVRVMIELTDTKPPLKDMKMFLPKENNTVNTK
ncbi:MAG: hypothetical protein HQ483_01780, partial [Rhodospirillales bacterium]|nr:hypothetical protein [Rhodospirillales bacterium]